MFSIARNLSRSPSEKYRASKSGWCRLRKSFFALESSIFVQFTSGTHQCKARASCYQIKKTPSRYLLPFSSRRVRHVKAYFTHRVGLVELPRRSRHKFKMARFHWANQITCFYCCGLCAYADVRRAQPQLETAYSLEEIVGEDTLISLKSKQLF